MRKRGSILAITFLSVLIVVVACGRASEDDINKALGIVPTATLSGEQIAQATKAAEAAASAIAAGGTPESDGGLAGIPPGDVTLGTQQFQFQCSACHKPNGTGTGPALTGPDSPVIAMSDQELFDLVRDGTGHTGQQPVSSVRISDRQLASIIAYIRKQIEDSSGA
jgi:mono/diheme cytochrome c family protein